MTRVASPFEVRVRGRTLCHDRLEVIALRSEPVPAVATHRPVEHRGGPQLERNLDLGRNVTREALEMPQVGAVDQHRVDESFLRDGLGILRIDRPDTRDLADPLRTELPPTLDSL